MYIQREHNNDISLSLYNKKKYKSCIQKEFQLHSGTVMAAFLRFEHVLFLQKASQLAIKNG